MTQRSASGADVAETYKRLLASNESVDNPNRWLKRVAFVAAVSLGGWLWRRRPPRLSDE